MHKKYEKILKCFIVKLVQLEIQWNLDVDATKYGGRKVKVLILRTTKQFQKFNENFISSSYTYDESVTYGKQLRNGTWIGMVGQVSRQVHT